MTISIQNRRFGAVFLVLLLLVFLFQVGARAVVLDTVLVIGTVTVLCLFGVVFTMWANGDINNFANGWASQPISGGGTVEDVLNAVIGIDGTVYLTEDSAGILWNSLAGYIPVWESSGGNSVVINRSYAWVEGVGFDGVNTHYPDSTGYSIAVELDNFQLTWIVTDSADNFKYQIQHYYSNLGSGVKPVMASVSQVITGLVESTHVSYSGFNYTGRTLTALDRKTGNCLQSLLRYNGANPSYLGYLDNTLTGSVDPYYTSVYFHDVTQSGMNFGTYQGTDLLVEAGDVLTCVGYQTGVLNPTLERDDDWTFADVIALIKEFGQTLQGVTTLVIDALQTLPQTITDVLTQTQIDFVEGLKSLVGSISSFQAPSFILTKFPFCIPWDLYACVQTLVAEPSAPSFDVPFRMTAFGQSYSYDFHIDFSEYSSLASICRWFFTLIFIVGLALLTSKVIKW